MPPGDHTVLDGVRVGQRPGSHGQGQVGHHSAVRSHVEQLRRRIADHLVVHMNSLPIGGAQARIWLRPVASWSRHDRRLATVRS